MRRHPWSKHRSLYSSLVPKVIEQPKIKWRVLPILWIAFKRTCMVLGAMVLVLALMTMWTVSSIMKEVKPSESLPKQMVLHMELNGNLGDLPKNVTFAEPFAGAGVTVKTFIDAIERAKNDPRVEGIYAHMNQSGYAIAHIEEIRDAILDFRESGKFAYIYAPSYDSGLGGYYLASSFEEIWMQPMGAVMITGINAEMPFLRNLLDKAGIKPEFFQRKEYKNAYESLTNKEMSEANRQAMEQLVLDISDVLGADIANDMGIGKAAFKKLVDYGLFLSNEALDANLIDKVAYQDELVALINARVTGDPESTDLPYINFDLYINEMVMNKGLPFKSGKDRKGLPKVALVYAVGAIMDTGRGDASLPSGFFDDGIAAADEIADALFDAAKDKTVQAVVLRIDSPGGSPVASETILRAVEKVQENGKSVTVSMGPTAASGGYWIAAYADQIFVLPTSLTGSIGVLGGKLSAAQLWDDWGVNWERISWGENSGMWSMNTPFSESEAMRMNAMLDNIYDNFLIRVAKGRHMSIENVEKIARGRVWVGKSALEVGIADQFGGLNDALDYAAVKAGAADRHGINLVIMPKPLGAIERLMELLEGQVRAGEIVGAQAALLKSIRPLVTEFMIMQDVENHTAYVPMIRP